ncbi:c-type cytochrome biogenesis protein CcsB [Desulfococcus multivorans]|uniref:Cytochrome c-type biogenesis protein CcsB n=1 Tax=Desulfococcus multivorans DSM 2059 TaxID=1121405 RepID=S7VBX9_DESML|nr:c-type cytochrome biogenesis protein CcsB [Desulfococcus multivorans]AOY57365.1 CcmC: cytochrome c assembly protein [Desulfococcus multivorans]AQV02844.2 c-type cytochrome biogenesis protein CcsB [Desulfococcus multivorans]EPR41993.1 cytochrome c-type biogenesis protein CcsB [Desulfococcus multivorans DSM 2059]SKA10605.1 cytochrome c-type biogenesis protein CcsB [Desulfococcus multivorans DSM 2059]
MTAMMDAMSLLVTVTMVFYILSTMGYFGYLFLQREFWQKLGYGLLGAGFFCHSLLLGYAFVHFGSLPAHNLHQTLLLVGWAVTGFFLVFQYRFQVKVMGIYAAPLAAFVMIVSSRLPVEPAQVQAHFRSFWLIFHVVIILLGEAAFAMACGVGILYLVQEYAIKNKKRGFFYRRLPSLELLDTTGYACIVFGFTLLTVGLIGGFLYAKTVWGRFWSGDPKEIWSGIMWLFYAALLHERLTVGWRGRKSAIMSIVGFVVLLFTFLGVNVFLKGHHGEFTQW